MQAVLPAAVRIQRDGFALYAIQAGCQGLLQFFPDALLSPIGAFAHFGGGVAAQVDKRGHRQFFHFAVHLEGNGFLRGERALQFVPGAAA